MRHFQLTPVFQVQQIRLVSVPPYDVSWVLKERLLLGVQPGQPGEQSLVVGGSSVLQGRAGDQHAVLAPVHALLAVEGLQPPLHSSLEQLLEHGPVFLTETCHVALLRLRADG